MHWATNQWPWDVGMLAWLSQGATWTSPGYLPSLVQAQKASPEYQTQKLVIEAKRRQVGRRPAAR